MSTSLLAKKYLAGELPDFFTSSNNAEVAQMFNSMIVYVEELETDNVNLSITLDRYTKAGIAPMLPASMVN